MLDRLLRQRRIARRLLRDSLGRVLRKRHPELARVIERDRVAVRELERRRVGAALNTSDRLLTDPLQPRFGIFRAAAGADSGAVRVAVVAALRPPVVA